MTNKFLRKVRNLVLYYFCGRKALEKALHNDDVRLLKRVGEEVIGAFNKVGNQIDCHFDLMFGTLLGAYRDHKFIEHDDDLDMTCDICSFSKEMLNALKNNGFELDKIYIASDGRGIQLPMKYKGLTSDIYFSYKYSGEHVKHIYFPLPVPTKDWAYSLELNVYGIKDITFPEFDEEIEWNFLENKVLIPKNTDSILKTLYGEDYMTPIKNAHVNPPVRFFKLTEKYYSVFPIDYFVESGMIDEIINLNK